MRHNTVFQFIFSIGTIDMYFCKEQMMRRFKFEFDPRLPTRSVSNLLGRM